MDLERLKIFFSIIDSGSMTAAAERLHLTQPALSRALKTLEDEMGVVLFERVGRGLVLSQAGRALESEARAVVSQIDDIGRKVKQAGKLRYFELRLGGVDSVVGVAFPTLTSSVRTRYPGINIKIFAGRSMDLIEKLSRHELDFGVVAYHGSPPADLMPRKICPYRLRFFGRKDKYPGLAGVKEKSQLVNYPLIYLDCAQNQNHSDSVPKTESYAVTGSMASTKALVMSGFGVGSLVEFMVSEEERTQLVASQYCNEQDDCCYLYLLSAPGNSLAAELSDIISTELRAQLQR